MLGAAVSGLSVLKFAQKSLMVLIVGERVGIAVGAVQVAHSVHEALPSMFWYLPCGQEMQRDAHNLWDNSNIACFCSFSAAAVSVLPSSSRGGIGAYMPVAQG